MGHIIKILNADRAKKAFLKDKLYFCLDSLNRFFK